MKKDDENKYIYFRKDTQNWRVMIRIANPTAGSPLAVKRIEVGTFATFAEAKASRDIACLFYKDQLLSDENRRWKTALCEFCNKEFRKLPNVKFCSDLCYLQSNIEIQKFDFYDSSGNNLGPCKLWKLSKDKDGYGNYSFNKSKLAGRAHTASFILKYGSIPPDALVRHICRNKNCVETNHLVLGTHRDNMDDVIRDKSQRGENHPRSLLSNKDRSYIINSSENVHQLAKKFNVSVGVIRYTRNRIVKDGKPIRFKKHGKAYGSKIGNSKHSDELVRNIFLQKGKMSIKDCALTYKVSESYVNQVWYKGCRSHITGIARKQDPRTRNRRENLCCKHCGCKLEGLLRLFCSPSCSYWHNVSFLSESTCWSWHGKINEDGYPYFTFKSKVYYAHTFSWDLHNPNTERKVGLTVAHTCHNKLCSNPACLELQSREENSEANKNRVLDRIRFIEITDAEIIIKFLKDNYGLGFEKSYEQCCAIMNNHINKNSFRSLYYKRTFKHLWFK